MSISAVQTVMDKITDPSSETPTADATSASLQKAINSIPVQRNALESAEPEIIPFRAKSPPTTPRKTMPLSGQMDEIVAKLPAERGRQEVKGSAILSTTAAKRRKKKNKTKAAQPEQALSTVRGFTPVDSGTEDSDFSRTNSPRVLSPIPRLPALAGAGHGVRPQSPGISSLKAQLDALNSRSQSRSTSRVRDALTSEANSSAASAASDNQEEEPQEDMVSYHVQIDQDFVSQSLAETGASTSTLSSLDADQRATSMIARKMTAADFTPIRCLGDGAFGTVLLVRQNATGRLFAQKQLTKAFLKVHKKRIESTKSERTILELVNRHPFIVNLYYAFQDHEKLYLILEYASGGELFRHLELEKFFSEEVAAFYIAEIVLALDYLHNTMGVIYRDLKPENCLLNSEGHLLLTDFGLSKVAVQDASTPGGSRCNSLGVGTIEYMAPEIIRGSDESDWGPGYGKACDWWSLGAMACDLMTGKPPFGGGNWTKIQQNILFQKLSLPYFLSPDAKDLLSRLLRKEPRKRLGVGPNDINIIKKHRFFRKIDWKKLEAKELEPPIKPLVTNPELAENFAREFTDRAIDTITRRHSRTLSKSDPFGGFSYVASNSLLEESMLSELDEAIIDEDI
ncbi:hypothetical protein PV04_08113 [Phialophora macrospora]|uniref:Protein kinase domain-containing protein n=1 Tax=Phialophora macrospora TaxID=1851006 RepID=A0A0D2FD02_9EURO|nr:hypothetical protein PV04_08113 [Phialophora macrospora]